MLKKWGPLAVLVAAIAGAYFSGLGKYVSLQSIAENRETLQNYVEQNWLLAILAYMALYIVMVALSLPGALFITITGGFLFGWFFGGFATVIGATIGATIIFTVAKTSLGATLAEKAGPFVQKLSEGFREDAFSYLLFLRLVPAFPFWLVNIAPALFNVPLATFMITTFLGIIPGTFAFSFVGVGLDSAIRAPKEAFDKCVAEKGADACEFNFDLGSLVTKELLFAFAALGVVALIPVVVKKLKARKTANKTISAERS